MPRFLLVAIAVAALFNAPLGADTPDPYAPKVRGLTHPRYAEREKAARDLEAAGEPALKALRAALSSTDEELRARAAVVAEKIERAARSKRLLVPPKLALKFDRVPLDQAVTQLANKTGLRFTVDATRIRIADVKRPVTLDTGEVPFWEAVDSFYRAAGLAEDDSPPGAPATEVYRSSTRLRRWSTESPGSPTTRLVDGKPGPTATDAAFRVRALPAGFALNRFDDQKGEITLHLDVDPVPNLNVVEIVGVEARKAVTDDRTVLAPCYPVPEMSPFFADVAWGAVGQKFVIVNGDLIVDGWNGPASPHFPVTLKATGARPRQLAELHGVVVARVMCPPEPLIAVPDVFGKSKGQTFRTEGLTCQVADEKVNAEQLRELPRIDIPPRPVAAPAPANAIEITLRLVSTGDTTSEILNLPVQIKGRLQPFIRFNRRTGTTQVNLPEFQVRDADGKTLRVLTARQTQSNFDGATMTQEVQLTIEKPAKGTDGISVTLTGRRPAVVEMPFVLKDVPLP